jgi:hypothetical protein|tara:strand:+ start:1703 stop:2143 length:441 start_codon:yes stop_codon:yes gene_type:complete
MRDTKRLNRTTIEVDYNTLWLWFEESIRTAKRLPSERPKKVQAHWVDIPKDWLAYGWDKAAMKLPPPTGKQISRLGVVLDLMWFIEEEDRRKLIWMRARRIPWKKLEYMFGKHRSTLANYLRHDLSKLTFVANTENKIRQKLQYCI